MRLPLILLFLLLGIVGAYAQPVITTQPVSQTVGLGSTVTFSVAATDTLTVSYQWQFNGIAIDLATSATLTLSDVTPAQAGSYTVYVYDSTSGVTSTAANLSLTGGPVINSKLNATAYSQTFPFLYAITAEYSPTSFGATGLPPGLSVNTQTGIISGIPTTTGAYQVTLTASNANGTGSATLNLSIVLPPYVFTSQNFTQDVAFSNLAGIASGGPSLFYAVDTGNNTIYQLNSGTLTATVFAGSTGVTGTSDGTGTAAKFNNPTGIAVDSSGNLYIADTANSTVRKITNAGVVTTVAGVAGEPGSADGPLGTAHLNYPQGVAVDSSGNVYVADTGNFTIRQISPNGTVTTIAGSAGLGGNTVDGTGSSARFAKPLAIVIDSAGNLYVEDAGDDLFFRKISTGAVVTTIGSEYYYSFGAAPQNLAIDSSGDILCVVPELRQSLMVEIKPSGELFQVGRLWQQQLPANRHGL
jgi:sugar lactone lactonase YvrE